MTPDPTVVPPTEKVCRYGNHVIDETDRRGFTTFYSVDEEGNPTKPDEYACHDHDKDHRVKQYLDTGVLTTALMTEAYMDQHDRMRALGVTEENYKPRVRFWFDRFVEECDRVHAAAKLWEREVWFGGKSPDKDDTLTEPYPGLGPPDRAYRKGAKPPEGSLQAFVHAAKFKGYRADVPTGDSGGPLTYLSYTMCGRSIFQVDDDVNGTSVGVILDEDSPQPRGGIKSVTGTADQAVALLLRAILDWKAGRVKFEHKDGVGFGF